MLETICTPYGKAAFPTVVKCNSCGKVIDSCGFIIKGELADAHYCDECACELRIAAPEFRICDVCGDLMVEGYCSEDGGLHLCENCFKPWMDKNCPDGWRANEHEEAPIWGGGFYDELIDGEWRDTGIFWTEWY